jgi:hypothetical protein
MLPRIFVVGFILFLSGCATPKQDSSVVPIDVKLSQIKSNKYSSYDKKIDRIIIAKSFDPVILQNPGDNKVERLKNDLMINIIKRLRSRGIETQMVEISRNSLDLNPMQFFDYSLATFKPNQVLVLTVPQATSYNGHYDSYTFHGVMYNKNYTEPVWDFNFYGREGVRSEQLGKAIFEKMDADGLLPAK